MLFGLALDFTTAAGPTAAGPGSRRHRWLRMSTKCQRQDAQHRRQDKPEKGANEGGAVRGVTVRDVVVHAVGRLSAAAGPGSAAAGPGSAARLAFLALAISICALCRASRLRRSAAFRAFSIDR